MWGMMIGMNREHMMTAWGGGKVTKIMCNQKNICRRSIREKILSQPGLDRSNLDLKRFYLLEESAFFLEEIVNVTYEYHVGVQIWIFNENLDYKEHIWEENTLFYLVL